MNKVVLIGRLTKDPELKFTPGSGTAVATFNIACDRRGAKDGQQQADFIPIVVWGKQAESTAEYMNKGKLIGISGRIQTRSYEAKDGSKRYVTEVVAEEVQFLEWDNKGAAANSSLYETAPDSNKGNIGRGQNFNPIGSGGYDDFGMIEDDGTIPF